MNQFDHIQIASRIIEASCRERMKAAETLEGKFREAFKEASEYWMSTDDDVRFKGGIGAVMLHVGVDNPEYDRIEIELGQLHLVAAAMSGIPVDWSQSPTLPEGFEPIGLIKLWKENK